MRLLRLGTLAKNTGLTHHLSRMETCKVFLFLKLELMAVISVFGWNCFHPQKSRTFTWIRKCQDAHIKFWLHYLSLMFINSFWKLGRFNVFLGVCTKQHGYRCHLHPVATVSAVCCSCRVTGEQPVNRWKYNSHPAQELLLKHFFSGIPFMLSFVLSFFYITDKWRRIFEGLWLGIKAPHCSGLIEC